MKALLVALGMTFAAGVSHEPAPQTAPPSFSLVIEATATGWAARCDSGCAFRTASFACRDACPAIADANGLRTVAAETPGPSPFSFRLEHTETGFNAVARDGTVWLKLGYSCRSLPCTARVTETGVFGR